MLVAALAFEINLLLAISLAIVIIGLILRKFGQPYIIAYILSGVVLGPHGVGMVQDIGFAQHLGDIGLIILMFFIGMEISLPDFVKRWRIAFFGTGMQVIFSLVLMFAIGSWLGWSVNRMILLGFIISISSSAVVIKLIETLKDPKAPVNQNVISILLTQDILIVPMIISITILSGDSLNTREITLQLIGGALIIAALVYLFKKQQIKLPFEEVLKQDHELQIFGALLACFGLALITSLFELSASLGALISGMFIHASNSTKWLHDSLHSFRVVLVSVFFVSVGMLIDLDFLMEHALTVTVVVLAAYLTNHGINMLALKSLGSSWREAAFGGALLAQIGEFSFVLASVGQSHGIITSFSYQMTIIVIAITIFISPFWIAMTKRVVHFTEN
ncbi:MAG: cation:proton antiporter [Cyclobacteriaceae bacterium]